MAWIAAIGFAVGVAATATTTAMVVGGMIVGAAVGALYSAVTGGNILKGILYGAIGGAVIGGAGAAMGYGAVAGVSPAAPAAGGAYGSGLAGSTSSIIGVDAGAGAGAGAASGAGLFTAQGLQAASMVMTAGSAFLQGGAQVDPEAQLAEAEKERQSRERIAAIGRGGSTSLEETKLRIASAEKVASSDLTENARQFDESLKESVFKDRETRREETAGRERFEAGVLDASKYVKGSTESVTLVESSNQRRNLPPPIWQGASAQPATEGGQA